MILDGSSNKLLGMRRLSCQSMSVSKGQQVGASLAANAKKLWVAIITQHFQGERPGLCLPLGRGSACLRLERLDRLLKRGLTK
jgi:hypothetical protein